MTEPAPRRSLRVLPLEGAEPDPARVAAPSLRPGPDLQARRTTTRPESGAALGLGRGGVARHVPHAAVQQRRRASIRTLPRALAASQRLAPGPRGGQDSTFWGGL